jgi:putative tryptophan/tyrosine transport system substrate-binding protein
MIRREFITLLGAAVLTSPLVLRQAAHAAPPGRSVTIGVIAPLSFPALEGLRRGFRELGYVEGRNLQLEYRWAEGSTDRYLSVAQELVGLGVDVVVTFGTPATIGAQQATATLPIVMGAVGDPLSPQLRVSNLSRPGGNVTGFSSLANELEVKRLQVLKDLIPNLQRLAVMANAGNPALRGGISAVQQAAQSSDLTIEIVQLRGNDFDKAFAELRQARPDAVLVLADPVLLDHARDIVAFISAQRLIAMYAYRDFAQIGGLLSYGTNYHDLFRRAAGYVDRILNGANPGDLPVQQADRFELVINLKTAKGLNLEVPATVLALADEVIE